MLPGFLPYSRAGFMMDFVATAMLVITPTLLFSVFALAKRRRYESHRKVQIVLGAVLLVAVLLFELDVRLYGWRQLAEPSPYYETSLFPVLYVHLFCAVSTTVLWAWTIFGAYRAWAEGLGRPGSQLPGMYSKRHKWLGWATTILTCATTVTGWTFYLMAFVA